MVINMAHVLELLAYAMHGLICLAIIFNERKDSHLVQGMSKNQIILAMVASCVLSPVMLYVSIKYVYTTFVGTLTKPE